MEKSTRDDGRGTAVVLTVALLFAFRTLHRLGLVIGAWTAVLVTVAATAALYWRVCHSRWR